MAWTQNLLGFCFSGCAPDAAFLGFAWWLQFRSGWGTISLFLGVRKATSQWLGHDFIVFRGSKSNTFSLFFIVFRGSKSNVSRFLRLYSCNGLDAKPAGALLFRGFAWWLQFRSGQWLGHDFIVFRGPKSNTFSLFFIVFRGSKSNVSRFLRLYSCNGLDAKPAGALLFRMRSRRSFLGLCLVAAVSQWLGHDFIVFRGSKSNTFSLFCFSLFLGVPKATFRDFWGCTPAMALTQNLLGRCFSGCAPDAAFLGFAWWLQFRSGWGTISLFLGVPKATRFHCFVFHCF